MTKNISFKNTFKLLFLIALSLCLAATPFLGSAADGYTSIVYDAASRSVVIVGSGVMAEGEAMIVHVASYSEEALSQGNLPIISDMFIAKKNGNIDGKIILPSDFQNGKYTIYAMASSFDAPVMTDLLICFEASSATAAALSAVNAAGTKAEFKSAVIDGGYDLGIDVEGETNFDKMIDIIYGIRTEEGALSFDEFAVAADLGRAYVMIAEGASVEEVMKKYASAFGTTYNEYSTLADYIREELDKLIEDSDLSDGFVSYAELVDVANVIAAEGYGAMRDYIINKSDDFGIDTNGTYADLSVNNRSKVFKNMYSDRKDFKCYEDVEEAFDKAVSAIKKEASKQNSSGGSSGGSSSGGGATSWSEPVNPSAESDNVIPKPVPAPSAVYTDIAEHFAKNYIEELSAEGVINGFEDGSFRPNDGVTRAQAAKIIALAFGLGIEGEAIFADVSADSWYAPYVASLASKGIVKGDGISFRPDDYITRQDAAVIISGALAYAGKVYTGEYNFADANLIADYAFESVNALAANGFLQGDGINFMPTNNITRGELAAIIGRLAEDIR